jgi:lambda family phage portal protein
MQGILMADWFKNIFKKFTQTTPQERDDTGYTRSSNYSAGMSNIRRTFPNYYPSLQTPNTAQSYTKLEIMAMCREVVTNDPAMVSALRTMKEAVVGGGFTLSIKPRWETLGISYPEAESFGQRVEDLFNTMASSPDCHFDATRQMTFGQMLGVVYTSMTVDGDSFGAMGWKRSTNGLYTCVNLLDSARIQTPCNLNADASIKNGVRISPDGEPLSYIIIDPDYKKALSDGYKSDKFVEVRARIATGRPIMLHTFDVKAAEQTTGISDYFSGINYLKLASTYIQNENQRMILQATIAIAIKSTEDYKTVMNDILGRVSPTLKKDESVLNKYYQMVNEGAVLGMEHIQELCDVLGSDGASKIVHLLPNEDISILQKGSNIDSFSDFTSTTHRLISAGVGADYATMFKNFSDTNYSGARFALAQAQQHFDWQKEVIVRKFAMPFVHCVVEEWIEAGIIDLPRGVNNFRFAKDFLLNGTFISSGKPVIDPLKEAKADTEGLNNLTMTLEDVCSKYGQKYTDKIAQIARERAKMKELGIHIEPNQSNVKGVGDGLANPNQ